MICVFEVIGGPARGKRVWTPQERSFEIGRHSSADFAVPTDVHMSRRHCVIESTGTTFRVRDVGSSNGTFVNNAKITTIELCDGDRLRVGETLIAIRLIDKENPHATDGLSFSGLDSYQSSSFGSDVAREVRNSSSIKALENESHDEDETVRGIVQGQPWWISLGFQATNLQGVWETQPSLKTSVPVLIGCLERLRQNYVLIAMLRLDRLGSFAKHQIGKMTERELVKWYSPTTCSVRADGSNDFALLAESAQTLDAMLLFAFAGEPDPAALQGVFDFSPTPSVFSITLQRHEKPKWYESLLEQAEFVFFERSEPARVCMFHNEERARVTARTNI